MLVEILTAQSTGLLGIVIFLAVIRWVIASLLGPAAGDHGLRWPYKANYKFKDTCWERPPTRSQSPGPAVIYWVLSALAVAVEVGILMSGKMTAREFTAFLLAVAADWGSHIFSYRQQHKQ